MSMKRINATMLLKEVKLEVEDEDEYLPCQLCTKTFANNMAIRNHYRNEHSSALESGLDLNYLNNPSGQSPQKNMEVSPKIKSDSETNSDFMSSLKPVSLLSLASEEVSYIIIKTEEADSTCEEPTGRKRKVDTDKHNENNSKKSYSRREKDPAPITGPFECLQPSTTVADGTCHQIFFSCCEYSIHFRDEHTKRRKGQRCQVCEKPLHPGEDQTPLFGCQVCGQGHDTNRALQEHINTEHTKLRPFQCSICNKRFTQHGGLTQHLRMHTGDRPFPCTICSKAFTQKSGLDQHLRTHTKLKPYRCVICSKTFSQSVHLKQHMRTHTNVSPFQCGICEKRFKQSSHLNYHLKSHTEATMTDEQKKRLAELMTMSTKLFEKTVDDMGSESEVVVGENIEEDGQDGEQTIIVDHDTQYVIEDGWCVKIQES